MMMNDIRWREYYTLSDAGITEEELKKITSRVFMPPNDEETTQFIDKFLHLFTIAYDDNWCLYVDIYNPTEDTITPEDVKNWENKFEYVFTVTADKYLKLLQLYKQEENNLLKRLGSQSETRFNDTPQDQRNDVATDGFNTTVTTQKNESDTNEMIIRLRLISQNYENLYDDWVDEFRTLFGDEI